MSMFRTRGFGLIEILVAIFVVAFGVLAVGKLQTNLITSSAENKARFEALSLAQGKLEDIKSYFQEEVATGELISQSNFITYIDAYPSNNAAETVVGTFATFTVTPSFTTTTDSDIAIALVSVSWKDSKGQAQDVSVNSALTFHDLGSVGAGAIAEDTNYIEAPTGRAHLGDGKLSSEDTLKIDGENYDGTSVWNDISQLTNETTDQLLVVGEDQIVLTLEDACVITDGKDGDIIGDYECTDFVRIDGRVIFNESYKVGKGSGVGISAIPVTDYFVLASDAAYCSRSFKPDEEGSTRVFLDELSDGVIYNISDLSTIPYDNTPEDSNSDLDGTHYFFDYTCYIGGGWHGNIGVVSVNENLKESGMEACVGDPAGVGDDNVEFSLRRSYRGMVWKYEVGEGDYIPVPLKDQYGKNKYISWGVADATYIGGNDDFNHDFLIVSSQEDCMKPEIMDKNTFRTNVDDFFCLNELAKNASGLVDPDLYNMKSVFNSNGISSRTNLDERSLDPDRDGVYTNPDNIGYFKNCPYDPTNPPYFVHQGVGSLHLKSSSITDKSASELSSYFFMKTSQGDNCFLVADGLTDSASTGTYDASIGGYKYSYTCDLYDYGKVVASTKDIEEAGFNGQVYVFDINETDKYQISCYNMTAFDFSSSPTFGWDVNKDIECDLSLFEIVTGSKLSLLNVEFVVTKNTTVNFNIFTDLLSGATYDGSPITDFTNISSITFDGGRRITYVADSNKFTYSAGGGTSKDDTYTYTVNTKDGTSVSATLTFDIAN